MADRETLRAGALDAPRADVVDGARGGSSRGRSEGSGNGSGRRRRDDAAATRSTGPRRSNWWVHVVLGLGGALMVFPFFWQIIAALSTNAEVMSVPPSWLPAEPQWGNFAAVFDRLPFLNQLGVTVSITVLRTVAQLLFCAMAGYAFARMHFPARGILLAVVLSILMVPPQVFLLPQYQIVTSLGLLNSVFGVALPGLVSAFGTFLMRQFFLGVPRELEDAARLDGANPLQVFVHIMLPIARPALTALAIITVLYSWNDLLWPLVVTTYPEQMPLSVGLATMQGAHQTDYPVMMAASLLATAPVILMFLLLQRKVIEGLAYSGMKG